MRSRCLKTGDRRPTRLRRDREHDESAKASSVDRTCRFRRRGRVWDPEGVRGLGREPRAEAGKNFSDSAPLEPTKPPLKAIIVMIVWVFVKQCGDHTKMLIRTVPAALPCSKA